MNTEPIGFKGTKTPFIARPVFYGEKLEAYHIVSDYDLVAVINAPKYTNEPREESAYDFALFAASKKMAVALQKMSLEAERRLQSDSTDHVTAANFYGAVIETCKEVLKEAGI